jgi:hypothetical protein
MVLYFSARKPQVFSNAKPLYPLCKGKKAKDIPMQKKLPARAKQAE